MTRSRTHLAPLLTLTAAVCALLVSGCKVVVEDYASANVFGRTTSGLYDPDEAYVFNLFRCETKLQPIKVAQEAGTAGSFINAVSGQFTNAAGWTFSTAANRLASGAIRVRTYDAQGTSTRVGAEIHILYRPGSSDPTSGVHWVQVVTTNHSLKPPAGHGNSATYVDVPSTATTPYYDNGYAANTTNFYDFPGRVDASASHTWQATTFLATGPAIGSGAGAVTFQRPGFTWGWINSCNPLFDFPGYVFYLEREITFVIPDTLLPGHPFTLLADSAEGLMLMRGEEKTPAELIHAGLQLELGHQMDAGGYYPMEVSKGDLVLGGYLMGQKEAGESRGTVRSGSGYLHWETGEASLTFDMELTSGEERSMFIITGTAAVSAEKKLFVLQIDTKGVERLEKE